ncbi:hypothetical protein RRG08_025254 [Elysia crispata]|uniref:Uncharacterized protein n=1 Tax=Elysia crispata TaxID=231223 RepID=A0AAE1ABP9_9GAST|nr:hypothetical protein RRG08_025254 [Elysia crispata]
MVTRDYFFLVYAISILLGCVKAVGQQDTSAMRDPSCSYSHCRKPAYNIIDPAYDCKAGKKYAKCIKRVLWNCNNQNKRLKDTDSIDELIAEFDAIKDTLVITGPNCVIRNTVPTLSSTSVEPDFTLPVYLGFGVITLLFSRPLS